VAVAVAVLAAVAAVVVFHTDGLSHPQFALLVQVVSAAQASLEAELHHTVQ
jgi:hypothetical protein